MKQQSAVEWIIKQLEAPCRGIPSHIVEQAKELERQQIESAYRSGSIPTNGFPEKPSAEEYYLNNYNA